jgi:ATP-dependent DNA ligase
VPLPITPPLLPQLARSRSTLPEGDEWAYEPKWDGFRSIAFVDGDELYLQSRNGKPLLRYFPELRFPPGRYVLDGEIVIFGEGGRQEFDRLGQRIHPAASRIERLAAETPARFIAFDLLARDDASLLDLTYLERRAALEDLVAELGPTSFGRVCPELTPMTRDPADAQPWLQHAEGVVAKEVGAPYRPGERVGMVKVKRVRTIDAVVLGWRPGKEEHTVGSLILGLYDEHGELREVGHSSGFKAAEKRSLVEKLAPYETGERGAGEPSRWRPEHELAWIKLRPELVVEITFDHVSSGRIRHGTKVQRWRDDKDPRDCTVEQLDS